MIPPTPRGPPTSSSATGWPPPTTTLRASSCRGRAWFKGRVPRLKVWGVCRRLSLREEVKMMVAMLRWCRWATRRMDKLMVHWVRVLIEESSLRGILRREVRLTYRLMRTLRRGESSGLRRVWRTLQLPCPIRWAFQFFTWLWYWVSSL